MIFACITSLLVYATSVNLKLQEEYTFTLYRTRSMSDEDETFSVDDIVTLCCNKIQAKITASKEELSQLEKKLNKKRKLDTVHLENKGNREQYKHCVEINNALDDIEHDLKNGDLISAKQHLEEGKKINSNRMKVIRIADRDDWLVASEFQKDSIFSDDEEEKRYKRALSAAGAKRVRYSKIRAEKQSVDQNNAQSQASQTGKSSSTPVICFKCHRVGHISPNCPLNTTTDNKKHLTVPTATESAKTEQKDG